MARCTAMVLALWPAAAMAQPVFFDDFQGPTLAPHWNVPPPSHWDHNFNNGMLNVTGLHYPSHPHISGNRAEIWATFPAQTDFRADVWMGWDAGQPWHRIGLFLLGPQFQGLAFFEYTDEGSITPGPMVGAGASNQYTFTAAPPPAIHQFTVARAGSDFSFFLNGAPFADIPDIYNLPLNRVLFTFVRSYPGEFAPLYVDRVVVVPAPGWIAVGGPFLLWAARRRRR